MLCGILKVLEETDEEMKDSGVGTANETGVLTHTQVPQKASVSISKVQNSMSRTTRTCRNSQN